LPFVWPWDSLPPPVSLDADDHRLSPSFLVCLFIFYALGGFPFFPGTPRLSAVLDSLLWPVTLAGRAAQWVDPFLACPRSCFQKTSSRPLRWPFAGQQAVPFFFGQKLESPSMSQKRFPRLQAHLAFAWPRHQALGLFVPVGSPCKAQYWRLPHPFYRSGVQSFSSQSIRCYFFGDSRGPVLTFLLVLGVA